MKSASSGFRLLSEIPAGVIKFDYLCIQEILVLTKSSIRTSTPFIVIGCEMKNFLGFNLTIENLCYRQLTAVNENRVSNDKCHMTASEAQVYDSGDVFFKFSSEQLLVI